MRGPSGQSEAIPPANQQPDNVGERIPADRKGSDPDRDRIDHRKRNHEEGHERARGGCSKDRRWPASYKGGKPDRQETRWTTFGNALALHLSPRGRLAPLPVDLPT